MALGDLFKAKENEQLKARVAELEAMMTPEMHDHLKLRELIASQHSALNTLQTQCTQAQTALTAIQTEIVQARSFLVETNEEVLMQSFGLYKPRYCFTSVTEYKTALDLIRTKQKDLIKSGRAATSTPGWTVNGDAKKGVKMIADMQKLLIRSFNSECDDVIDHVKFNNIEAAAKRIATTYSTISKLGTICGVAITGAYRDLKLEELYLAHEYQIEKQHEKDRLKQLRAEERERAKLETEIAEARHKIEKEQKHYSNALIKIMQQLSHAAPEDVQALEEKKAEIESQLTTLKQSMEQIDYRVANQKAGYVYIISNVGAFGEGVYKIGMTRRLEPMDRIDELGDASVPFDFDVHALIFSEDAPGLEASLHRAFEDRKLNMINTRREFFRVSLDEIKTVVKNNFDKTVEFIDIPAAEQYRQSELIRNSKGV